MDGNRTGKQNCYKMHNRVPGWGGPCLAEDIFFTEMNNIGIWVRSALETHRVSTRHLQARHTFVCHVPNSSLFQSHFTIVSHWNKVRRELCMAYTFLKWPGERRALTHESENIKSAMICRWVWILLAISKPSTSRNSIKSHFYNFFLEGWLLKLVYHWDRQHVTFWADRSACMY